MHNFAHQTLVSLNYIATFSHVRQCHNLTVHEDKLTLLPTRIRVSCPGCGWKDLHASCFLRSHALKVVRT